ncbi:ATP-binding protein [Rudanella lutea]|uniref:ATP-binding protein n=1 Tax=Rudanella lutea TaxID=451374 RepID=UPI00037C88BC|nr:ATP-binding protein [Rudanella lutea]
MTQLHQQVARRLTRFYILALTVIALLSVAGLLFIHCTIRAHNDDSRVVNIAGRQRMLSQRLTKLALLRTLDQRSADSVAFDSLLNTWAQTHRQLRDGVLQMEKRYTVRPSATLDSMMAQIEPSFQIMYRSFRQFSAPGATAQQRQSALEVILQNELSFVEGMNTFVFQFDRESFERVQSLSRIEWFLTGATLLVLLIEGLFVFRPVVAHTRNVIRQLDQSEQALQETNRQLEGANTALAAANASLAETNRELLATQTELLHATEEKYRLQLAETTVRSAALLEGQEEERRRFARELHDGIGQMLTGLKLHAEKLKSTTTLDDRQRARFAELCDLIYETIQTTRQVSYNLMPSTLSDFGLGATLNLLAEQTTRSSGTEVVYEGPRESTHLSPAQEIGLYRIAQEALHNAVKYARALQIIIHLRHEANRVELTVRDNGQGFRPDQRPPDSGPLPVLSGLENMRTRARLLHGELNLQTSPGSGTEITVSIPTE